MLNEEPNIAELVEQITTLTAERDKLRGDVTELTTKVTDLESNEIRLNKIVASTVLTTNKPETEDQTKSFGDLYAETIKEMMKR